MDENEKAVLRRRRAEIASKLEVSRDLLRELGARSLIGPDVLRDIEREKTDAVKAGCIIDALLAANPTDGFSSFCSVLEQTAASGSHRLARELENDLKLERGELKPRQELIEEAAVLVHRKFGPSKRFSESDKREVAELIAVKLQLSHDDWQREIRHFHNQLDAMHQHIEQRDQRAQQIIAMLREFARKHETQLTSHSHDMTTTQQLVRQMMQEDECDDGNTLPWLHNNLKAFFHQVKSLLNHRDSLYYEKEKCLKLLGVKDNSKVQLDEIISNMTGLTVNADMSVETKDSVIGRLQQHVETLEIKASNYETQLQTYKNQLADKEREIAELRRQVHIS